jgi:hypothetical protein
MVYPSKKRGSNRRGRKRGRRSLKKTPPEDFPGDSESEEAQLLLELGQVERKNPGEEDNGIVNLNKNLAKIVSHEEKGKAAGLVSATLVEKNMPISTQQSEISNELESPDSFSEGEIEAPMGLDEESVKLCEKSSVAVWSSSCSSLEMEIEPMHMSPVPVGQAEWESKSEGIFEELDPAVSGEVEGALINKDSAKLLAGWKTELQPPLEDDCVSGKQIEKQISPDWVTDDETELALLMKEAELTQLIRESDRETEHAAKKSTALSTQSMRENVQQHVSEELNEQTYPINEANSSRNDKGMSTPEPNGVIPTKTNNFLSVLHEALAQPSVIDQELCLRPNVRKPAVVVANGVFGNLGSSLGKKAPALENEEHTLKRSAPMNATSNSVSPGRLWIPPAADFFLYDMNLIHESEKKYFTSKVLFY